MEKKRRKSRDRINSRKMSSGRDYPLGNELMFMGSIWRPYFHGY